MDSTSSSLLINDLGPPCVFLRRYFPHMSNTSQLGHIFCTYADAKTSWRESYIHSRGCCCSSWDFSYCHTRGHGHGTARTLRWCLSSGRCGSVALAQGDLSYWWSMGWGWCQWTSGLLCYIGWGSIGLCFLGLLLSCVGFLQCQKIFDNFFWNTEIDCQFSDAGLLFQLSFCQFQERTPSPERSW